MIVPDSFKIEIISSSNFIEELITEEESKIQILEKKSQKPYSKLSFGVVEIAAIVAIVQGTFYIGELAYKIYEARKKNKLSSIVIKTQFKKIEIDFQEKEFEEEEIKSLLKKALKL
jgi:hypothetical protein